MTCVVGITYGNHVYIGSDRSASNDITKISICRPKVHIKNNFVFAYAGSFGTGQLMEMIDFNNTHDDPYYAIRLSIVEQMKKAMESFGSTSEENVAEFLIGYKGRLFEFCTDDWSVIEIDETAVGSGSPFALGSLYTTKEMYIDNPHKRISMALDAAILYSPTCMGKIDIISTF
jgi:20S proteasome alpha/beta subunit